MYVMTKEEKQSIIYTILELKVSVGSNARVIFVHPDMFCMLIGSEESIPFEKLGVLRIPMGLFVMAQDDGGYEAPEDQLTLYDIRFFHVDTENWETFDLRTGRMHRRSRQRGFF